MNLEQFFKNLKTNPSHISFEETMSVIDENYIFSETGFYNNQLYNKAGENSGSCRLFAFAQINKLAHSHTLSCFGQYYQDVKNDPDGDEHQNIRQFMLSGWSKVSFDQVALVLK